MSLSLIMASNCTKLAHFNSPISFTSLSPPSDCTDKTKEDVDISILTDLGKREETLFKSVTSSETDVSGRGEDDGLVATKVEYCCHRTILQGLQSD